MSCMNRIIQYTWVVSHSPNAKVFPCVPDEVHSSRATIGTELPRTPVPVVEHQAAPGKSHLADEETLSA